MSLQDFDIAQQPKILNTINKVLFDLNSVLIKENKEPFQVGVRFKSQREQYYIYNVFNTIFNGHNDIKVICKEDENDFYIVEINYSIKNF